MTDTLIIKAEGYFHRRCGEKGGVTAGWVRDYENEEFIFSFAVCHPDDLYNKKVGRDIVDTRLNSPDRYVVSVTFDHLINHLKDEMKGQDVLEYSVIDQIMSEVQFADVKTKALVKIADNLSHGLMWDENINLTELVYGS